jgi:hypothetical protein
MLIAMNPEEGTPVQSRPRRRRALIAAAAVLAVAVGGAIFVIGRGNGATQASATTTTASGGPRGFRGGAANGAAFQKFQACMKSHGVTLTPGQRPDFGNAAMQAAMSACRSYLPARPGGFGGGGPGGGPVGGAGGGPVVPTTPTTTTGSST